MTAGVTAEIPDWARRWPAIAGALVALLGAALLVVRARGAPLVAGIDEIVLPTRIALAFAALGGALLLAATADNRAVRHARWPLELGALALGALGAIELGAWQPGGPFGGTTLTAAPASLLASGIVALCALGLLTERLDTRRGRGLSRSFATLAGLIGLVALFGYLFGAPQLYQPLPGDAPLGVLAATGAAALGSGIVGLHAQQGLPSVVLAPTMTGRQMRWSLLAAMVVPLLMGGIALRIYETYPAGSVAIALMAAGITLLLGVIVSAAAYWLRRAEDRLELSDRALTAIPQGVFIVDSLRVGRPNLYVNSAYAALTGYSVDEAVDPSFDAAAIFADSEEPARLAASAGDGASHRVVVRRRNGTVFPAKLALNAVPRADGSHYVIGLIDDVTAEELATKQRLELLAEAAQARSAAEAANRAKDTFFASLSHELRSPLNACVMWLDVLALGPQADKIPKAVEAIRRNLARQTRLVNDLIDAAKISSGGIEVHVEPLDLTALLKRHVDTWQLLAIAKQLSFEYELEPTTARVQADGDRLLQVLNNLIENAIDNTPAGGRVSLKQRNAGDVCLVEVADTGVGLSAEDAANLFTPFWRAPGSTRSHKGLGLGLAIAHHLVTEHGGSLAATSDGPGAGTVFTVSLPLQTDRGDNLHSDAIASTAS
jgi:PAS domain S-box-containing protein